MKYRVLIAVLIASLTLISCSSSQLNEQKLAEQQNRIDTLTDQLAQAQSIQSKTEERLVEIE